MRDSNINLKLSNVLNYLPEFFNRCDTIVNLSKLIKDDYDGFKTEFFEVITIVDYDSFKPNEEKEFSKRILEFIMDNFNQFKNIFDYTTEERNLLIPINKLTINNFGEIWKKLISEYDIEIEEFSGTEIWNYIVEITDDESMVPTGFEKKVTSNTFILNDNYDLNDLIKSDIDFKNYYESGEERYEDEEKMYDELTQPIVIVDGELIDGYSRASYILRYNDEPEIKAYINIETEIDTVGVGGYNVDFDSMMEPNIEKIETKTEIIDSLLIKKINHLKNDYLENINHISNSKIHQNTVLGFAKYLSGVYKQSLGLSRQIAKLIYDDNYAIEFLKNNPNASVGETDNQYTIEQISIVVDKILQRKLAILKNPDNLLN